MVGDVAAVYAVEAEFGGGGGVEMLEGEKKRGKDWGGRKGGIRFRCTHFTRYRLLLDEPIRDSIVLHCMHKYVTGYSNINK